MSKSTRPLAPSSSTSSPISCQCACSAVEAAPPELAGNHMGCIWELSLVASISRATTHRPPLLAVQVPPPRLSAVLQGTWPAEKWATGTIQGRHGADSRLSPLGQGSPALSRARWTAAQWARPHRGQVAVDCSSSVGRHRTLPDAIIHRSCILHDKTSPPPPSRAAPAEPLGAPFHPTNAASPCR